MNHRIINIIVKQQHNIKGPPPLIFFNLVGFCFIILNLDKYCKNNIININKIIIIMLIFL